MSVLQTLFSVKNIKHSWKYQKTFIKKNTSPGIDGQSRSDFDADIALEAVRISREIRDGSFRFKSLRPIAIPKAGDKDEIRLINVPTVRDRFVQRILSQYIAENYGPKWHLPQSFSSMRGFGGVQSMLDQVGKSISTRDYVIKADLAKYFDTIPRNAMKKEIRRSIRHRSLHDLLCRVVDCETSTSYQHEQSVFTKSKLTKGIGIRQGMPLSPIYAYLFLMDLDRNPSTTMFRYVDDILMASDDKSKLTVAFEDYSKRAKSRGLTIHPLDFSKGKSKTQLIGPHENLEFLGVGLKRTGPTTSFYISKGTKNSILESAKSSCSLKENDKKSRKNWLASSSQKARNIVRDYQGAYRNCENWEGFSEELRQYQISMFRNIVSELNRLNKKNDTEALRSVFGA